MSKKKADFVRKMTRLTTQSLDRKASKVSPSQLLILESRTMQTGQMGGISKAHRILIAEGESQQDWGFPPGAGDGTPKVRRSGINT